MLTGPISALMIPRIGAAYPNAATPAQRPNPIAAIVPTKNFERKYPGGRASSSSSRFTPTAAFSYIFSGSLDGVVVDMVLEGTEYEVLISSSVYQQSYA